MSRAEREVVGWLINNQHAIGDLGQKSKISILFDRNFCVRATSAEGPDNLWQRRYDGLRQIKGHGLVEFFFSRKDAKAPSSDLPQPTV